MRVLNDWKIARLRSNQMLPLCQNDFALYCAAVYGKFLLPEHIKLLIEKLEGVERGEIKRLMVSMPPRHGKTLTTSALFPSWFLGRDSSRSVAIATYGESLAKDLGRKVQQTVSDPLHRAIFPESRLSPDVGAAERLEFEAGGSFFAVSRQGTLTGRGCDLLVCDDLLKDQNEARSAAIRRSIVDFYERVGVTRLTPEGAIVLVGTRWGKGDLFDYLLDERAEDQWTVLNLPAVAEENDPLGRAPGEALWPEKYNVKHLAHKKYEMGTSAFVCLYQGHPAESEGLIFKREWWRTYTQLPELKRTILSLDSAFKTGLQNDYSAIQVWGEAQTGFYLLTAWKLRVAFPDLKRSLVTFADQWKPSVILIEDAASGQSLIQELQSTTSLPIKPIKVDRDKESRASACTGMLESGRVFVPADAPWLADFLDELSSFPNAPHDDQVDSCTMALNFLRGGSNILGWVEYLKSLAAGLFREPEATPSPRSNNLNRQRELELEIEIRGLKPAVPLDEPLSPCPQCQGPRIFIGGCGIHCNGCGATFANQNDKEPVSIIRIERPCCGSPLLTPISNGQRCNNCGWQTGTNRPTNGVSREQALSGRWTGGRAKMNSGAFRQAFARLMFGGRK